MDKTERVRRARAGDADAFAELYETVAQKLYRVAYHVIGNHEQAQDAVMEAVCDAFTAISGLRDERLFEAWIMKILFNRARRRKGEFYYGATSELDESIPAAVVPLEQSVADNADLMNALSTLSEQERMIVVLSVCEGYTSAELSRILSMNANTVRTKQARALAKLRKIMKGEE